MNDSDYFLSAEWQARMAAMGDQLDARAEQMRSEQLREYLEGHDPDTEPWEPVRLWIEQGVWCAILVGPIGALCGYARLPDSHPWIGLAYDHQIPDPPELDLEQPAEQAFDDHGAIPIFTAALSEDGLDEYARTLAAAVPVHGGITWTGPMPIVGAPHGWWIGFDCGHAGDKPPRERWLDGRPWTHEQQYELLFADAHEWTEDEVALEVKRMVPPILAAIERRKARPGPDLQRGSRLD